MTKAPLPAGKGFPGQLRVTPGTKLVPVSASLVALSATPIAQPCPWDTAEHLAPPQVATSICASLQWPCDSALRAAVPWPPLWHLCPSGIFYDQHPGLRFESCSWQLVGGAGRTEPHPALQRGGTAASDSTQSWARHRAAHIYIQPCFFSLLKLIQAKNCSILSGCSLDQEEYHWELLQRSVLHAQAKLKLPHVSLLVAVLLLKSLGCSYCKWAACTCTDAIYRIHVWSVHTQSSLCLQLSAHAHAHLDGLYKFNSESIFRVKFQINERNIASKITGHFSVWLIQMHWHKFFIRTLTHVVFYHLKGLCSFPVLLPY